MREESAVTPKWELIGGEIHPVEEIESRSELVPTELTARDTQSTDWLVGAAPNEPTGLGLHGGSPQQDRLQFPCLTLLTIGSPTLTYRCEWAESNPGS
jgi:hypothetical protein